MSVERLPLAEPGLPIVSLQWRLSGDDQMYGRRSANGGKGAFPPAQSDDLFKLLQDYTPRLQRAATSVMADRSTPHDAEDVVAEIIAKAHHDGLDHIKLASPYGYLLTCTMRRAKRYRIKDNRDRIRETRDQINRRIVQFERTPEDMAVEQDTARLIRRAIRRLPNRERVVVYLKYYEERSNLAIGLVIGVTEQGVGHILRRAYTRLGRMSQIRGLADG